MDGKEFERRIDLDCKAIRRDDAAWIARNGVKAAVVKHAGGGLALCRVYPSFADYTALIPHPTADVVTCADFDAKVCSAASFNLSKYRDGKYKPQLDSLTQRATFGSVAFFLIHWNSRELKTRIEPAATYAFPIHPEHEFWVAFAAGETTSINREACERFAVRVHWYAPQQRSCFRPDVLRAIADAGSLFHRFDRPEIPRWGGVIK